VFWWWCFFVSLRERVSLVSLTTSFIIICGRRERELLLEREREDILYLFFPEEEAFALKTIILKLHEQLLHSRQKKERKDYSFTQTLSLSRWLLLLSSRGAVFD